VTLPSILRSSTFGDLFNVRLQEATLPRTLESLTCHGCEVSVTT
jgi:hypothetical protein